MLGVYKLTGLILEYSVSEVCYGAAFVSKGAAVLQPGKANVAPLVHRKSSSR